MAIKASRNRVTVTLSSPMRIALNYLADREGSTPAAQASLLLRQGLDRTIQSAEVQRRIGAYRAQRTRDEWVTDQVEEHAVETQFAQAQKQL